MHQLRIEALMVARVAEHVTRRRFLGPRQRLRVDLHGVSVFGPGDRQTLIRWEWIDGIEVDGGVIVRGASDVIELPKNAFGLAPVELAEQLRRARSIEHRPEVIGRLNGQPSGQD